MFRLVLHEVRLGLLKDILVTLVTIQNSTYTVHPIKSYILRISYIFPCHQGRPGVNGYKGEKGDPSTGSGYAYPVSMIYTHSIDRG